MLKRTTQDRGELNSALTPGRRPVWFGTMGSIALLAAVCACACAYAMSTFAAEKALLWKAVDDALLRVDDRPVNDWNVYEAGKKNDPFLLKMGGRFLLIDVRGRQVFEIAPAKIEHKGADLLFDPKDRPEQALGTSDWVVKDVGLAYRCSAKLTAEMRVIDVQIPHPLDLRSIVR